jgi:hypothetical protein
MKSLCSSKETDELFGCQLLYISKQNNHLMERVKNDALDKRMNSNWERIDASVDDTVADFSKLNENDLRNLTLGEIQDTILLMRHVHNNPQLVCQIYIGSTILLPYIHHM